MKAETRREEIMDLLMRIGSATVDDLAGRFGVSKMTVHRDLDDLERSGLLRKVRGGASIQSNSQFESDFRYRERLAAEEKRWIAAAAADLIEAGQTIIIDDGSTAGGIADLLAERKPVTVITNNLAVIEKLAGTVGVNLIALGGQYHKKFHGFFGIVAEEALRSLRADIAFLSSSAICEASAFHQDQEVVHCKRLMMQAAQERYLLVDHAKFGKTALHFLADLTAFDAVITGKALGTAAMGPLSKARIALRVAAPANRETA